MTPTAGTTTDCGNGNNDACNGLDERYYGGFGVKRGAGNEIKGTMTFRYTDDNAIAVSADARHPPLPSTHSRVWGGGWLVAASSTPRFFPSCA